MNCNEVRHAIHDYVDGDLSQEMASAIGDHVDSCQACSEALASIADLVAEAGNLPRAVVPDRDLWAGIAPHIEKPSWTGWVSGLARPVVSVPVALSAAAAVVFVAPFFASEKVSAPVQGPSESDVRLAISHVKDATTGAAKSTYVRTANALPTVQFASTDIPGRSALEHAGREIQSIMSDLGRTGQRSAQAVRGRFLRTPGVASVRDALVYVSKSRTTSAQVGAQNPKENSI
jgi:hypothetical protein